MELTYDEIVDYLHLENIARSTTEDTLPPGIYKVTDINLMLKSLLPNELKVKNTIVDIKIRSNLTTNKTKKYTKKIVFLPN